MNLSMMIELNNLSRENAKNFTKKRFIFDQIAADIQSRGKHFTGITGPRGSGKTILLKQLNSVYDKSFYISLDTFEGDLFEIFQKLHQDLGIKNFLLDEVHFYRGFEGVLKKIYDFLDIKVVFTSSAALLMRESAYDLSRRVLLRELYPFSFREFIYFTKGVVKDPVSFEDIIDNSFDKEWLMFFPDFQKYISGGIMPFALQEPEPLSILGNILSTVIYKDIARVSNLGMDELDKIAKIVSFIGKSAVDGINYTSLSKNISITKFKAEQYVDLLEKSFIIHRIFPKGTNVIKEPKILMALPYRLLYRGLDLCSGGLREDFFAEMMRMRGRGIFYLKNTRGAKTPDFLCQCGDKEVICEVGGRTKGAQQFKGISIKDKIIFSDGIESQGKRRPLMLLGVME